MNTKQCLLDHASELIRTRGYSSFSYADLAERVRIRKASIHHHFPSKEDLGVALVERYIEQFGISLSEIALTVAYPIEKLRAYADLYRQSLQAGWGCLCGMLASEVDVVPQSVAIGVRRFMDMNLQWLTQVIGEGQKQGSIESSMRAVTILSICQGALLVARSTQNCIYFDQAIESVLMGKD
jgi:TetR/AcrR family transcriptional repressor of nem operon